MAEAAALVGFVAAVVLGPVWVYLVGLAFALVGFARLAPTRRHIELDQQRLAGGGCHRSLLGALMRPM